MSFTADQKKLLKAPLLEKHVSSRAMAGRAMDYIEGWHAISEANRIFGFDAWDSETELTQLGEPQKGKDKYGNDQYRVRYMAVSTIKVRAGDTLIKRQGVGFGSGIAKDVGDAFEGAIKEAETDSMKRALRTFGNPFGLALYDKTRANVSDGALSKAKARELYQELQGVIDKCDSVDALSDFTHARKDDLAALPADWRDDLRARFVAKKAEIQGGKKGPAQGDLPSADEVIDSIEGVISGVESAEELFDIRTEYLGGDGSERHPALQFPADYERAKAAFDKRLEQIGAK